MRKKLPDYIAGYLNRFAEDNWTLEWQPAEAIKLVIVIPALSEFENIKKLLHSLEKTDAKYHANVLVMFVVNNTIDAEVEIRTENLSTLNFLKNEIHAEKNTIAPSLNIGLVDASSPGFELPAKDGGVGYARKIGMDISLKVFSYSESGSNVIACLDADCTVETNYITKIFESSVHENFNAGYVEFEHPLIGNEEEQKSNNLL